MPVATETLDAAAVPSPVVPGPGGYARPSTVVNDLDTLIRNPRGLDAAIMNPAALPRWLSGLIRMSVVGLLVYGALVGSVAQLAGYESWLGAMPALTLPLTLVSAFMLTLAVCLPSFYFYTQLSGLDVPFRFIVVQALRVQAHTSVLLLGALPFYAALALSMVLPLNFNTEAIINIGLALPFIMGLTGIRALHASFKHMLPEIPITHERRGRFLLRMVLAWGAVFSVVAPVAMYTLGRVFAGWFG
jgi:hypothetical protein